MGNLKLETGEIRGNPLNYLRGSDGRSWKEAMVSARVESVSCRGVKPAVVRRAVSARE